MLQILLVSTVVGSVGNLGGALLCANGVAQVPARIGMEANALRIVAVAAQPWIGVIGMTVGLGLVDMYVFVRGIRATSRFLRKHPTDALAVIRGPAIASAITGPICWELSRYVRDGAAIPEFAAAMTGTAGGLVFYMLMLCLLDRQRIFEDVSAILNLARRDRIG